MIPAKHKTLLRHLARKSEKGEASWYTTSVEEQYGLQLEGGVILLDRYVHRETERYSLAIINDEGQEADRIWVDEGEDDYDLLKEAYDAAHRVFWRIDEVLDGMIKE